MVENRLDAVWLKDIKDRTKRQRSVQRSKAQIEANKKRCEERQRNRSPIERAEVGAGDRAVDDILRNLHAATERINQYHCIRSQGQDIDFLFREQKRLEHWQEAEKRNQAERARKANYYIGEKLEGRRPPRRISMLRQIDRTTGRVKPGRLVGPRGKPIVWGKDEW